MRNQPCIVTFLVVAIATISTGKRFYITSTDECSDCGYHDGTNYAWCTAGQSQWDYCSTKPGHATRGDECKDECGFHGYSYRWCNLKRGGWDYCSLIEETNLRQYTTTGDECQNYCKIGGLAGYYVCRNRDRQNAHCSPEDGLASHGSECKSLFNDGKNSCHFDCHWKYSWCKTNDGSWGYCSKSELQNVCGSRLRTKRAGIFKQPVGGTCDTPNVHVIREDSELRANGVRIVTYMFANNPESNRILPANRIQRENGVRVLAEWRKDTNLKNNKRTTQHSNYGVRLDIQATINTPNHGSFRNYQLQINGANLPRPTTLAQVIIPESLQGYDYIGWRRMLLRAFSESLRRGACVWIFQQHLGLNQNPTFPSRTS